MANAGYGSCYSTEKSYSSNPTPSKSADNPYQIKEFLDGNLKYETRKFTSYEWEKNQEIAVYDHKGKIIERLNVGKVEHFPEQGTYLWKLYKHDCCVRILGTACPLDSTPEEDDHAPPEEDLTPPYSDALGQSWEGYPLAPKTKSSTKLRIRWLGFLYEKEVIHQ